MPRRLTGLRAFETTGAQAPHQPQEPQFTGEVKTTGDCRSNRVPISRVEQEERKGLSLSRDRKSRTSNTWLPKIVPFMAG